MTSLREKDPDAGEISLGPETSFAHYRIVSKIGAGGMGEVYKALDTQMRRFVALKVLRPELLHDVEKVRRFAQEAKTVSSLNHPAIVTIYEVATASLPSASREIQYIAMEFVEGPSLRQYFRESPPMQKLLGIIVQVAEGMAKAHGSGVVHRDLKPDNIMLTAEGQPKIVDFGLAKLVQPELLETAPVDQAAPTMSLAKSHAGAIMGTVGYMSPEQVEGRPADHRSDVFSLGCVLYEAVAGRAPFNGDSVVAVLHSILRDVPDRILDINPNAPPHIERVIRRCLAKDPDERYQSIKEIAIEIREVLAHDAPRVVEKKRTRTRAIAAAAGVAAVAAVIAVAATLTLADRKADETVAKSQFTPFSTDAAYEGFPSWSPDGKSIAYIADVDGILQVFVKGIDSAQATQITHAVRDCREPFWDPRGNRIFYISLAQDRDTLWSVGVGGGEPEVFLKNVYSAAIAPDRGTLAILRESNDPGNFSLNFWTASPPEAAPKRFAFPPGRPSKFANGFIRFSPDNTRIALWSATRFDPETTDAREFWIIPRNGAPPYSVLPALKPAPRGYPFAWLSDSRRIVFGADYLGTTPGMHLWIANVDTGELQPLTRTNGNEYYPSVSPTGDRIVYSTEEDDFDLIRIKIDGSSQTPFLATSRTEKYPVWSPVRDEYIYITNRSGPLEIWMASGDGQWRRPIATAASFDSQSYLLANASFSPDGQRIAYQRRGTSSYRIWISTVAGGPAVAMSENRKDFEDSPTWSPDGNWIAYTMSNRGSSSFALAKMRMGSNAAPVIIRNDVVFPSNPHWSPRGDWITLETTDGFSVISPEGGAPRLLSEHPFITHAWSRDGGSIYGIAMDENLHLLLSKIDIAGAKETIVADLGASAPMINPVEGLTVAPDGKSLLTSMAHLKGDLWIVQETPTAPKR